ncbi:hypothetical protein NHQ30_005534 [Ciborinia camelliae]|nr:hypothetical protein NHQ30_005534 [Ciborinia camelliae]
MGELDELVSTLLNTFTSGIRLLKVHRKRHRTSDGSLDTDHEEAPLIKSFKRSRSDIREAYRRDSVKSGPKFSEGDATDSEFMAAKARSSLSTILSRLNIAFTSAVTSFSRGKVKPSDQAALIQLSNKSRAEAISTLDGLSKRLSNSTSSLSSRDTLTRAKLDHRKRNHDRTPAMSPKPTALGPATKDGWVRPKSSKKDIAKSKAQARKATIEKPPGKENPVPPRSVEVVEKREPIPRTAVENRKSGFSFASDSTKIGEIPEYRVARLLVASGYNGAEYSAPTAVYPLAPYHQEPQKRRFGIGKLFKSRPTASDQAYSN